MTTFGERLKELREERGLTQEEVAKYVKTTRSAIGKYENGERFPSQGILIELADRFNVSLDYLHGRSDTCTPFHKIRNSVDVSGLKPDNANFVQKLIKVVRLSEQVEERKQKKYQTPKQ